MSKPYPYGTWICKFCNEIFETRHKLQLHRRDVHYNGLSNTGFIIPVIHECCKYCNRPFTREAALSLHERCCRLNPNRQSRVGHKFTEESKIKMRMTNSLNHKMGGYRKGSGIGKSGWYKGIWCDSSWELAFVIYNLDNGIEFKRNTSKFKYEFNNEIHNYIPDFIIDDTYIEIKGRITEQWKAKFNQFPKNLKLKVITGKEINTYLNYVISKYGDNFIELYDK